MPYTWKRAYEGSQTLTVTGGEWDEVWNVYGYDFTATSLAIADLTDDRPDLAPGQPHGVIPNAYVDTFEPKRLGKSRMCQAAVRYAVQPNRQPDVSPLDRPAEISVETETIQVPTFKRVDGSLIVTTAGTLIYGLTRPVNRTHFLVEKNVATVPAWLLAYSDIAVNDAPITIEGLVVPTKTGQLQKVRASTRQSEMVNGVPVYYRVLSFSVVHDPRGWDEKVYNRSLYQKFEGRIVPCFDSDKEPTTEPFFLDSAGAQLPLPLNPDDVIEIDGVGVTPLPFSALPLT